MAQGPNAERDNIATDSEIIPLDLARGRSAHSRSGVWISVNTPGSGRLAYVATPGPIAIILVLLTLGILLAAILLFVLGTLLLWISVFGVLLAALFLSGIFRGYLRRLR